LDIDFDANIDLYVPEPVDLTDTVNEFEENEFEENEEVDDIDDIGNDPDYIPDPEPKKPRIQRELSSMEMGEGLPLLDQTGRL